MFHRIIFLLLIVSSLFCNFHRCCAVCFQSLMNIQSWTKPLRKLHTWGAFFLNFVADRFFPPPGSSFVGSSKESPIPKHLQEATLNWGRGFSLRKAVDLKIVLLGQVVRINENISSSSFVQDCIHRRTGRGGRGGLQSPQTLGNSDFLGSKRTFGQSQFLKTFPRLLYYYFEEINIFYFNLKSA